MAAQLNLACRPSHQRRCVTMGVGRQTSNVKRREIRTSAFVSWLLSLPHEWKARIRSTHGAPPGRLRQLAALSSGTGGRPREGLFDMDTGILILRVAIGLLIYGHAMQKALGWFHGPGPAAASAMFDKWGFRPARPMVYMAAAVECTGGLLLVLGLATPLACAMLIATLAVACLPNLGNGLWAAGGGYELALLYGLSSVALAFTGSGRYSVDAVVGLQLPPWAGLAVLIVGLLSAMPVVARRRTVLSRERASQ